MLTVKPHKQPLLMTLLLGAMVMVGRFAFDLNLPALPVIAEKLSSNISHTQQTITFFSVGFGLAQLLYGPLSDYLGRKKVLLSGFICFIAGCLLASFAQNIKVLMLAWTIAGIGISSGIVMARAIARDLYSGQRLVEMNVMLTLVVTISLFVAPILGNALLKFFGWRANYSFLLLLGLSGSMAFYFYLPETNHHRADERLSFTNITRQYKTVIGNKLFFRNMLLSGLSFAGLVAYFQMSAFIFEREFHYSTTQYSDLYLLIALVCLLSVVLMRSVLKRSQQKSILQTGILLMIVAGILMLLMFALGYLGPITTIVCTLFYVLGFRLVLPITTANCLMPFKHSTGAAAAMLGAGLMLIASMVSYFISLINTQTDFTLACLYAAMGGLCLVVYLTGQHKPPSPLVN